jgi:branched-chain amino acid transport system substrate-binding protein
VQVVTADEGDTRESGKAAMEKLKGENVLAISGVANAPTMTEAREIVEAAHIPLIGSNASPQQLSTLYIWRTSYVDTELGDSLGEYVASQLRGGTAYMIASDVIGRDAVKGFQSTFNAAKGKVEGQPVFVPVGTTDFAQWLQPLKANTAVKAIFAFFSGASAEAFVKQYAGLKLNEKIPLYAPGAAARGVYTALNYSPDLDNTANRQFAAEYQKRNKINPTTYAMASYDAASVLDKALKSINRDPSGETLNAAIGKVGQINSPRGDWQFNGNRSPQQQWYLRQVRMDGQVLSNNVVSQLVTFG